MNIFTAGIINFLYNIVNKRKTYHRDYILSYKNMFTQGHNSKILETYIYNSKTIEVFRRKHNN